MILPIQAPSVHSQETSFSNIVSASARRYIGQRFGAPTMRAGPVGTGACAGACAAACIGQCIWNPFSSSCESCVDNCMDHCTDY